MLLMCSGCSINKSSDVKFTTSKCNQEETYIRRSVHHDLCRSFELCRELGIDWTVSVLVS